MSYIYNGHSLLEKVAVTLQGLPTMGDISSAVQGRLSDLQSRGAMRAAIPALAGAGMGGLLGYGGARAAGAESTLPATAIGALLGGGAGAIASPELEALYNQYAPEAQAALIPEVQKPTREQMEGAAGVVRKATSKGQNVASMLEEAAGLPRKATSLGERTSLGELFPASMTR